MCVRTFSGAIVGIDAKAVTVEVNIAGGSPGMYPGGLLDNAVKENEQRIRTAFKIIVVADKLSISESDLLPKG